MNAIPGGTPRLPSHDQFPEQPSHGSARHTADAESSSPPTYRYEYKDPYAPMSTAKQVVLGCAISLVLIAFAVAAFLIGQG
ncbi:MULTISPECIES: hypothetical protein [unclassified Gordonia (in: high G+C Gram-positive bacteria)]|uniref:hypothetical protein n=1 Tax=unclassified Gordonia (in: high G+C Gram-positive bacteria) TaxID=2657482 RepID=UPI00071DD4B1|nr:MULTISPECIES: hypothetical protein [unclassified Gordonia (in: high G+C Gram-positive bacteria)]KSU53893.1 hypothetical protein AS181_21755 [Gordonia sp. SGD-V-85]MCT1353193.1 hypothetical protein [Gordonia sp. p3-SID1431]